jgi:hypothetical protein
MSQLRVGRNIAMVAQREIELMTATKPTMFADVMRRPHGRPGDGDGTGLKRRSSGAQQPHPDRETSLPRRAGRGLL